MSTHSTYDLLRHLADSWGLLMMTAIFLGLCAWPFLPGNRPTNRDAANSIFKDEHDV